MSNEAPAVVAKLWNFCNVLRDDGVSYGDYVQQLTNLLFLKMADEQTKPPFKKESIIPKKYDWTTLTNKTGDDLETHYRHVLENLATEKGLLGVIFRKSQNKIQDPAKLERLVKLIDGDSKDEILWSGMDIDVKGEIYEGLLEKNAEDVKSGAGQYFTPRALISTMVDVIQPKPKETIGDPACGTGGFFLSAHKYLTENFNLDPEQKKFLRDGTFKGWDIVTEVVRLCAMSMYLHGIGSTESQITAGDSLISDSGDRFDIIMTNPPFGKKSSTIIFSEEGKAERETLSYERDDFWATTSNKQLNFLQHVKTILKVNGRCAIVVPDNVLFEGGAGETVRQKMLEQMNCHTLLRLPTGIFYAGGVKANVLFFDKKPARTDGKPWTEKMWIYDFRTNQHFTLKENQLTREHLDDFVKCYNAKNILKRKETDQFHAYSYAELIKRDKVSLDIFWLKDESLEDIENLPPPEEIAEEIKDNLESALDSINELIDNLGKK
ncbi:Type I restriction enzyme StySJI M protein [Marine Group I thaumarchaeote SCGC AAA799-P11]|uniref:site-specific DNA-methyltransferase (adenine-specific) n=1 Tax=Marine Group I thaumarchaeote SCGC AAA799-P11 TaxID=1502295 RepID=A0A087RXZ4_9ARCH|nr:Type I restriction enzyme StySJI M protein [Marine Group I thaumarchaeote SCGC AAA799-P11]